MTKEEFISEIESNIDLKNDFEDNPLKVVQDMGVELTEDELSFISGGVFHRTPDWIIKLLSK